jgi:signal transduction histidine kinase/ActR/RegA family two-component response regulator
MNMRAKTILIYIFFGLMLAFGGTNSYLTIRQIFNSSPRGWIAAKENNRLVIAQSSPTGPTSVLKVDDEIVELRSLQAQAVPAATDNSWMVKVGYRYEITISRAGKVQKFALQTTPYSMPFIANSLMASVVVPWVFLITALIIFLLRRNDEQVQLLAVMLGTFIFDGPFQSTGLSPIVLWIVMIGGAVSTISTPVLLHFFLKFPKPAPILNRFRAFNYLLYVPYLILVIPYVLLNYYYWAFAPDKLVLLDVSHPVLTAAYNYALAAYLAAGLILLVASYIRAGQLDRRKVRVIVAGFILGAVPFLLRDFVPFGVRVLHLSELVNRWYFLFAMTALLLLPVSLSYAIVRYQVIPVSVIVRRGVRYLIVKRGFLLIEGLIGFSLLSVLLTDKRAAMFEQLGQKTHLLIETITAITLIQLIRIAHKKIVPLIDRRFFRETYDVKQILSQLAEEFVEVHDVPGLLRLVTARIQATLHAESVAAWAFDSATGSYKCIFSATRIAGEITEDPLEPERSVLLCLPKEALTVSLMSESNQPLTVDFPNPQSWVHARLSANGETMEARLREHILLQQMGAVLMLPVALKGRLQCIISLGARRSDLPYSSDDQKMLASVIWLTAFAVENLELFERERVNQEQLRQAQKMEAVGRLAGGVAHDFNNLLTVIGGYSDLALRKVTEESPVRRHLIGIKNAGDRAADLTRQLLAFSRKQVLQPRVLGLNSVVADVDKMLRRLIGEDIDFLTALDDSLGQVMADPGQVEQILMNLVVNARDAMPNGGKLTIQTANVSLDEEYARTHNAAQPGSYIMLAVSDTGCGIDAQTRERIFEPFFTTKEVGKGTGLGLSTVYGIVKQSGGNIWVYSEVGHGTTFKVYFPRIEQQAEVVAQRATPMDLINGTETVLLVEDEDVVRKMVLEILQLRGYDVLEARHGKEALALAAGCGKSIHMMVTDVVMPQMNGPELAGHLEQSFPDLKVLYMSGYTDEAIVHHGVLDEGVAFLEKPFTPDALARKVREVLNSTMPEGVLV